MNNSLKNSPSNISDLVTQQCDDMKQEQGEVSMTDAHLPAPPVERPTMPIAVQDEAIVSPIKQLPSIEVLCRFASEDLMLDSWGGLFSRS